MTTTRPTCQSCPYWQQHTAFGHGQCRRKSPRDMESANNDWAITNHDEWCGDHPDMAAYIAGLAGTVDALREAVLATVPAMVDQLSAIERREGSNLSVSAVHSLDQCQDQLQVLLDLAAKETP